MQIVDAVAIELPCAVCGGRYELTLRQVALSQRMLHEGCPVHAETECPPLFYAGLTGQEVVREFQEAWLRLEQQVRSAGGEVKLRGAA